MVLIAMLQIGGGVLHDCWRADERGTATAIYSVAPFLGPAVAPIGMWLFAPDCCQRC